MNRYNLDCRVGFSHLLADDTVSLPALMERVQECSLFHTLDADLFGYYEENDLAWVLTHWQVEISRYPKVGEVVNISTWPVGFKGYFGLRGFEVADKGGSRLLAANSNWMLLNRSTLKPVRPTPIIAERYGDTAPFLLDKDFSLPDLADFNPLSHHTYTPTRRDCDTNRHVNNANYLKWVYDLIPRQFYTGMRVTKLKVAYKQETLPNDLLTIKPFTRTFNDRVEMLVLIEKNRQVTTEIFMRWK
ncbi:MAG: thioesterase [Defluviitaleaceae bacterium]|nr:thioesterase [Defluviitaleaceae bacterium]